MGGAAHGGHAGGGLAVCDGGGWVGVDGARVGGVCGLMMGRVCVDEGGGLDEGEKTSLLPESSVLSESLPESIL